MTRPPRPKHQPLMDENTESCEGFQWLGQSWEYCHRCSRPWHEHAGVERPAPGAGPFSDDVVIVPWVEIPRAK